ncbi:hypothetical protein UFOVP1516_35 [uncultured Caudovirales phage]|uniref:Uncharacterized protein n=1 Tax=uncultured Caudovirales phage TaxID=2100421 RepID=A0A6J7XG57_9CAUD|nr:hypothetical protein UFOVP887_9 [uncultured Caudovirales phage]CAB5226824.1 hypothetical protein UFOVP1516_35 [uncultured Caudovirales phage]
MARKNPTKAVVKALERHRDFIRHVSDRLKDLRVRPEQVTSWMRQSEERWIGMAEGANVMLEDLLHDQNCYNGFCYLGEEGGMYGKPDDADFCEWRRSYF